MAVGGDGTVNAVASWLHERHCACPVAIVPAGTGNNLARGLKVPLDTDTACRVALAGDLTTPLDVLLYRDGAAIRSRLMLQTGALGFPADIAMRYDRLRRNRLFRWLAKPTGTYIYRILALIGLARQKWRERRNLPQLTVRCQLEGETIEEQVIALFIGNEGTLGGDFIPCPRAEMDDGKLDICLVRAGTGHSYLRLFARVARGDHLDLEDCVVYRQTAQPVDLHLSETSPLLADGDLWVSSDRYHLEVLRHRLEVVVGGQGTREKAAREEEKRNKNEI